MYVLNKMQSPLDTELLDNLKTTNIRRHG